MLSLPRAWVPLLVGELRSCRLCCMAKKKKKKKKERKKGRRKRKKPNRIDSATVHLHSAPPSLPPSTIHSPVHPSFHSFFHSLIQFSSFQLLTRVRLFMTPWTAACQASLSITNARSSLKLMSTESVMPSNHLILCHPLLLLPSNCLSIRVFSSESVLCNWWPKD